MPGVADNGHVHSYISQQRKSVKILGTWIPTIRLILVFKDSLIKRFDSRDNIHTM